MCQQTHSAYDVFISYSHVDKAWVQRELLPQLEEAGLRVLIDYRDFTIGAFSLDNMEWAVDNSRHTLVVLTPAWIASEWTAFEGLLAEASDPAGRRRKLLPLLLEPCPLPRRINLRTYADFTNPADRAREIERLVRAISPRNDAPPMADASKPADCPRAPDTPQELTASERDELAELLRRSGRADRSARQALCIEMRIDPDNLNFLTDTAARNFALQFVSYLHETGNTAAMLRLGKALQAIFKDTQYAATLTRLEAQCCGGQMG